MGRRQFLMSQVNVRIAPCPLSALPDSHPRSVNSRNLVSGRPAMIFVIKESLRKLFVAYVHQRALSPVGEVYQRIPHEGMTMDGTRVRNDLGNRSACSCSMDGTSRASFLSTIFLPVSGYLAPEDPLIFSYRRAAEPIEIPVP